jgi:hypothetical protein
MLYRIHLCTLSFLVVSQAIDHLNIFLIISYFKPRSVVVAFLRHILLSIQMIKYTLYTCGYVLKLPIHQGFMQKRSFLKHIQTEFYFKANFTISIL